MEELNNHDFSDRLKLAIKEAGTTQKDLAEKVNVSKTAMNNYANGRIPEVSILFRIARVCNTSMEWLLAGEDNNVQINHGIIVKHLDPETTPQYQRKYCTSATRDDRISNMKSLIEDLLNEKSELKETPITEQNIIELANYLGTKAGIKHNLTLSKDRLNTDEREVVGLFNQLSERNKGRILATMEMMIDTHKLLEETENCSINKKEKISSHLKQRLGDVGRFV